jgi:hypothetical protein
MNRRISLLIGLLFISAPAFAGGGGLFAEINRFAELFDGAAKGGEVSPPQALPMPKGGDTFGENPWWKTVPGMPVAPKGGEWGVPSIEGVPIESPAKHRDVFKEIQPCQAADYVYLRQPSTDEAITTLNDCLGALSKRYGVSVTAAEGKGGIVLMISGLVPPGSTLKSDLKTALQLRGGKIYGIQTKLVDLERPASDKQTSSLQPIVDRCGIEPESLGNAAAFVSVFGECIRGAKGISITALRPDASDELLVLVYSRDSKHLIREMNGVVRVLTPAGVTRLRVHAQREILTDGMIDKGLSLPALLSR